MRFFGKRRDQGVAEPEPDQPTAAEPAEPEPEPEPPAVEEDPGPPPTIAIVDDDEDVLDVMSLVLSSHGFEVVGTALDGAQALDLVARLTPDLVLLDLHMPDFSGLEALPRIRELSPSSKIVIHSAIGATHMVDLTIDAGATAYIEKGLSFASIVHHLERVARSGSVRFLHPYPLRRDYPGERDDETVATDA